MITNDKKRNEMGKKAKQNIQKFLDTRIEEKWNQLLENGEILMISVIIPMYNLKRYYKSAVESVLNQTYKEPIEQ